MLTYLYTGNRNNYDIEGKIKINICAYIIISYLTNILIFKMKIKL